MKNLNLDQFTGKNISFIMSKADELFKKDLEGIVHAHKIYNMLIEEIPNTYDEKKFHVLRGDLRQKIWNCERKLFWNEKFPSQQTGILILLLSKASSLITFKFSICCLIV